MRDVVAACIQTPPGGVATPEYVDDVLGGAAERVELAVLPELCTVPYFPLEEGSRDAEAPVRIDGPELAAFGDVARRHGCHLAIGVYLADGERRFNAAVLLGPNGVPCTGRTSRGGTARSYHKVHLCDVQLPASRFCETAYFAAGDDYVVWDLPFGCVGMLICYDRHFPEAWVAVRDMGAEIVCVPTTSGMHMEPSFVAEIQGMSLQQSVYALQANRVGVEELRTTGRRTEFLGGSCITGPIGEVLAAATYGEDEPLVSATLRTEPLEHYRLAHQFHEHRRPDTYVTAGASRQETTA
jgi:predicted amidohydrolase